MTGLHGANGKLIGGQEFRRATSSPGSPARGPRQYLIGPSDHVLPADRRSRDSNLIDDGFQAFNAGRLSEACQIFADKMLAPKNDTTIGLTIAGAMTPAGLGGCVIEMMERGLVDFLISTGANLYHDLHYALNFTLRRGSPFLDDRDLYAAGVIRIYDVLFPGDGAARDGRVHPRVPDALRHERPGVDVGVPLPARARI